MEYIVPTGVILLLIGVYGIFGTKRRIRNKHNDYLIDNVNFYTFRT